ncbi:MAG: class I SAM-dependent methyltransferase [Bacteroidota bacterium]
MQHIEIFEGDRASNYDSFISSWMPHYPWLVEQLPSILWDAKESEAHELLIAGCGTGNEIISFLQSEHPWQITGVDPSPEMIRLANEKLANASQVRLIEGLVNDLPKQASFSAATLILVLHFMPDDAGRLDLLRQISDRLIPGAPFLLVGMIGTPLELKRNLSILGRMLPEHINPADIEHRLHRIATLFDHISEVHLLALLEQAGFGDTVRFFQASIYGGWLTKKQ